MLLGFTITAHAQPATLTLACKQSPNAADHDNRH
jgi:hypothetical protein